MDTVCEHCKYDNPIGANFCMSCGKPMARPQFDERTASLDATGPTTILNEEAAQAAAGTAAPSEPKPAIFVVRVGPKRGSRIAIDADLVTIGRHPESDIFLDDITVSRRHVEVHRRDGVVEVADAGSLNGTYVNKELIERAVLNDGDELQIGKFKLVYLELGDDD